MGSILYDFLSNSLFLNERAINTNFSLETEKRIERELIDYRAYCVNNLDSLKNEINGNATTLSVFSSQTHTPIRQLKQTALYINQYIVSDPLFRFTRPKSGIDNTFTKHLGFNNNPINKQSLTEAAKYLKDITPMIRANFVKIFPVSYYFEPPDQLPLNLPFDYYNEALPVLLREYFHANSIVSPIEKLKDGGLMVVPKKDLKPCRAISVEFGNIQYQTGMIYFLYESKIESYSEETGEVNIRKYLPDSAPEDSAFKAWVNQSINSASKNYFDRILGEIIIASKLKSSYICDNPFCNELVSKNFGNEESMNTYVASQMLNIDLPFLEKIDTDKLMSVRENDSDTFTTFRLELEKHFRELRTITDPYQIKLKSENIFHELNEIQGQKIKLKMGHLQKQVFINSILAIGGLVGTVATGGVSLLSTAFAVAKGYKDYKDYLEKVKENPAYFLWKVKKGK